MIPPLNPRTAAMNKKPIIKLQLSVKSLLSTFTPLEGPVMIDGDDIDVNSIP